VIESVDETQALIEELLRLGAAGGDGMMKIPETGHEDYGAGGGSHGVFLSRTDDSQAQNEHDEPQDPTHVKTSWNEKPALKQASELNTPRLLAKAYSRPAYACKSFWMRTVR
jgi:hypothetical protein